MELLLSNFPPIELAQKSSKSYFEKTIKQCRTLQIASGYVSADALIELKRTIEANSKPHLELLIGMHYFDGFTKTQYTAAQKLNTFLLENNLGAVFLSTCIKFHGKMYSFTLNNSSLAALIGSSNLGSLYNQVNRLYEADIALEGAEATLVHQSLSKIITQIGSPLDQVKIDTFIEPNRRFKNHSVVKEVATSVLEDIKKTITAISFELPIKTEPKSGLNAYFGKGRVGSNGYEMPRSWYEGEIIVSNQITNSAGYPKNQSFKVYTDDYWTFDCETNGAFAKNFRSKSDLKILGEWIKGRLEDSNVLTMGCLVNDSVLSQYGRKSVKLSATTNPSIWFLDFSATK